MLKLDLNPSTRVLRQFALGGIVGVPLLTAVVLRFTGGFSWSHPALWIAAAVGLVQCGTMFAGLSLPTRALHAVLTLFGFCVSTVLLLLVYLLVFTPIGLVFRAMGRDVLGRRLEPQRASYWHERGATRRPDSYFKLY